MPKVGVAILGGGIGGLSAAHHLARADVDDIHVFEATGQVGGMACTQELTVNGGTYKGEHGFRLFPHFYRHVTDTMRTTPSGLDDPKRKTVWDHLRSPSKAGIAYNHRLLEIDRPVQFYQPDKFVRSALAFLRAEGINGRRDVIRYTAALLKFATSCTERRHGEYDDLSWEQFTGAADGAFSDSFRALVIQSTRNLAAMRAPESSAATIGAICMQMMFDFDPFHTHKFDALLDGPTTDVWLRPWRAHLEERGVTFHCNAALQRFNFDPDTDRLRSVVVDGKTIEARWYVCAVPLDKIVPLLTDEMRAADPALAKLPGLLGRARGDMAGAQFFLRDDIPLLDGHLHFPGTPFGLTAVSQRRFWDPEPGYGIISVIISDWTRKNEAGKAARDYTDREELLSEVWRQLESSLPLGTLASPTFLGRKLDDSIQLAPFRNATPLLTHPTGQRRLRPRAQTKISNLTLAADYVRTHTDLASMEGADEAARRAVRVILAADGAGATQPAVTPLSEGIVFWGAKQVDRMCFRLGLPHPFDWPDVDLLTPERLLRPLPGADRLYLPFGGSLLRKLIGMRPKIEPVDDRTATSVPLV